MNIEKHLWNIQLSHRCQKQSAATSAARPHKPVGLSPAQFVLLISHPKAGCNAVQRVYRILLYFVHIVKKKFPAMNSARLDLIDPFPGELAYMFFWLSCPAWMRDVAQPYIIVMDSRHGEATVASLPMTFLLDWSLLRLPMRCSGDPDERFFTEIPSSGKTLGVLSF